MKSSDFGHLQNDVGIAAAYDARGRLILKEDLDVIAVMNDDDLQSALHKPLRCNSCGCRVFARKAFKNKFGTRVPATFGQIEPHGETCPNNLGYRLAELEGAHESISRYGKVFQLKLGRAPTVLNDLEIKRRPNGGTSISRDELVKTTLVVQPVIRAARAIIRLLHDFRQHPLLIDEFRVNTGSEVLRWEEFCWPAASVEPLRRDIVAHPTRMRAVYGIVEKVVPISANQASAAVHFKTAPASSVIIRSAHPHLIDDVKPGEFAVGLGTWSNWVGKHATQTRVWVQIMEQTAHWDPRYFSAG